MLVYAMGFSLTMSNKCQRTQKECTDRLSRKSSHVFRIFLVFILVIIVIVLVFLLFVFGLLGLVFLLFLGLFHLAQFLPLFGEGVRLGHVIGDNDVVEDGASLHLPEIEPMKPKS